MVVIVEADGLPDIDHLGVKINIPVNIKSQSLATAQATIEHDNAGGSKTVVALPHFDNDIPFALLKGPVRSVGSILRGSFRAWVAQNEAVGQGGFKQPLDCCSLLFDVTPALSGPLIIGALDIAGGHIGQDFRSALCYEISEKAQVSIVGLVFDGGFVGYEPFTGILLYCFPLASLRRPRSLFRLYSALAA